MGLHDRDYGRRPGASGSGGGSGGGFGFGSGGGSDLASGILRVLNASFPVARILDIQVRIHITFVLLLVFRMISAGDPVRTLKWMALLFGSVLLHEFGHCLACRRVGGEANQILMWPLGGLAFCAPPREPWPEFVTVVWGPLVNIIIAAATYLALLIWLGAGSPVSLNPLDMAVGHPPNELAVWLGLLFIVNYGLTLFNLMLIFYPFDGGRIVQIALWTRIGYVRSMRLAAGFGMIGAAVAAAIGLIFNMSVLVFIAIFGFLACRQQRIALAGADEFGDFEGPHRSFKSRPPKRPGLLARTAQSRAERAAARQADRRRRLDEDVDQILAKIHESGIGSLTTREKRVLEESSRES